MRDITVWLAFGALAGWIASLVIGSADRPHMIVNIVVGMVGALLGGAIMKYLGAGFDGPTDIGLVVTIGCSVVFLAVFRRFKRV